MKKLQNFRWFYFATLVMSAASDGDDDWFLIHYIIMYVVRIASIAKQGLSDIIVKLRRF